MKTRVISAVIAASLLIIILLLGGYVMITAALIATLIGIYEFSRAFKLKSTPIQYIMTISFYAGQVYYSHSDFPMLAIMILFAFIFMAYSVFSKVSMNDALLSYTSFYYITIPIYFLISLKGTSFLLYPFLIAFGSDSFAYICGKTFGKHKLIPSISPNKTVEGAVGSVILTTILVAVYGHFYNESSIFVISIMGFVGSIVSQIGDLIASKIKRETGIKDFGSIMPGHGGILDRLDSILVTSLTVYMFYEAFLI